MASRVTIHFLLKSGKRKLLLRCQLAFWKVLVATTSSSSCLLLVNLLRWKLFLVWQSSNRISIEHLCILTQSTCIDDVLVLRNLNVEVKNTSYSLFATEATVFELQSASHIFCFLSRKLLNCTKASITTRNQRHLKWSTPNRPGENSAAFEALRIFTWVAQILCKVSLKCSRFNS